MNKININGKDIHYTIFRNQRNAIDFARSATKTWVVMGYPGEFWMVRPVDAGRLQAAGFEIMRHR